MLMREVAIHNLDAKIWTEKNEMSQGKYLFSLIQPAITGQWPFELTDINYD